MPDKIAVFKDVSYKYPRSDDFVLLDLNLEIYEGEFLGIIGSTGVGKTTICLALNGIVPQFYGGRFFGSVHVGGLDTVEHPISAMANYVGQVFEDPETQLISTSVENEIAFALENLKVSREVIIERIPQALSAVRLEGTEKKHPHELSGGQKQRLAIAAAIAVQPSLLILDEPTSQLDPVGAEEVFATAHELNQELDMTIVMASHSAEEMAAFADRIALVSNGQIVAIGPPDEIYADIEILESNDLRPPQVANTFYSINKRGISVPKIPVNLNDALPMLDSLSELSQSAEFILSDPEEVTGEALLSVKDLAHVYPDGTKALHGVSVDIAKGEYVLIIGQNGAGKSTLVKHFLNLLQPTEGVVKVGDVDTEEVSVSDLARRIGYVAQNPDNQIFNASVGEEIAFALKNLDFDDEEVETRTVESLEAMGLTEVRDMHPLALPKGDRARVVIGAILAMKPEIIIFDEPTTGQDYRGAKYILEISRDLHKMGKTVIVITHHLYLMPEYAERVVVMGKGTILLDDVIRKAFHETETLKSTYLSAPQAVHLSQEMQKLNSAFPPLLTPGEFADYFAFEGSAS
ncbi:MAG: ATP-binding cassette domain-containing protein [Anaerolineales bacterium]|nr:ATP-binding cassette domain-containing protein [Chloroflexota bacterium]MBL6983754.1 ATP-binding cassette domain-containing protein [Anaerolineales bacterium]